MRDTARRFGRELYCHRNISQSKVSPDLSMKQAVFQELNQDAQRAVLSWFDKKGPFWDGPSARGTNEYFEHEDKIVTENAIGEAAYRCAHGEEHHLVSFAKSKWQDMPVITVQWCLSDADTKKIDVCNHWEHRTVENALQKAPVQYKNWDRFGKNAVERFANLAFSVDCFSYLKGCPFSHGVAAAINERLHVLDRHQSGWDVRGQRGPESQKIFQDHFTRGSAWFSDSSKREQRKFEKDLTFQHPDQPGSTLFCTWHGKVMAQTLRIHFSWPNPPGSPLYVVYVGPKITKE